MKTRVRKDRLSLLATVLESLDGYIEPKFDMNFWVRQLRFRSNAPKTPKELADCSTSACAAGFASTIPAFRKEGFVLRGRQPYYDGEEGFQACEKFFGLNAKQARRVFGGTSRTLAQEVQVIRRFVARAA